MVVVSLRPSEIAAILPDFRGWIQPGVADGGKLKGQVVITAPLADRPVSQTMTAEETARRVPKDIALWLIVQVGDYFYPQGRVDLLSNGSGNWARSCQPVAVVALSAGSGCGCLRVTWAPPGDAAQRKEQVAGVQGGAGVRALYAI